MKEEQHTIRDVGLILLKKRHGMECARVLLCYAFQCIITFIVHTSVIIISFVVVSKQCARVGANTDCQRKLVTLCACISPQEYIRDKSVQLRIRTANHILQK